MGYRLRWFAEKYNRKSAFRRRYGGYCYTGRQSEAVEYDSEDDARYGSAWGSDLKEEEKAKEGFWMRSYGKGISRLEEWETWKCKGLIVGL